MKYPKLSILALTAATVFSACNSKLDLSPGNAMDENTAITEGNSRILANGLYERAQELEYYGRDFMVVTDVTGNDMKITPANSNRFIYEFQYIFTPLTSSQSKTWQNAYRVANQASVMIDKLPATAFTAPFKGEAHFMRALAHFDMVRRYTVPYAINSNPAGENTGVPLVMAAVDVPAAFKPSRATLNATYDAIISDLKAAQESAPDSKPMTDGVFRASKDAATALLSRAYLYKGDWTNAIAAATALVDKYALWTNANYLANYTGGSATSEDIFGLRFLTPENRGADNFGYIYLPMDGSATGGYGDIRLTEGFMSLLEPADYRNTVVKNFSGSNYMMKWSGNGLGLTGLTNVKVLRISEVLLNRAEAYVGASQIPAAVADINKLRKSRGLADFAGTGKEAVLAEIMKQRRLELVGEGFGATDLFRSKGSRVVPDADAYLPDRKEIRYDNPRVAFPIPQAEIDANPNIVQNPGYNK